MMPLPIANRNIAAPIVRTFIGYRTILSRSLGSDIHKELAGSAIDAHVPYERLLAIRVIFASLSDNKAPVISSIISFGANERLDSKRGVAILLAVGERYHRSQIPMSIRVEESQAFVIFRDRLRYRVIPSRRIRECLAELRHRAFIGLELVFYVGIRLAVGYAGHRINEYRRCARRLRADLTFIEMIPGNRLGQCR